MSSVFSLTRDTSLVALEGPYNSGECVLVAFFSSYLQYVHRDIIYLHISIIDLFLFI